MTVSCIHAYGLFDHSNDGNCFDLVFADKEVAWSFCAFHIWQTFLRRSICTTGCSRLDYETKENSSPLPIVFIEVSS